MQTQDGFPIIEHSVDLCVVGGGLAGMAAAIAAVRKGLKVVLMNDRPVLGGNSSSEIRVHVCGADRHMAFKNMRETGILEEWRMENLYHNPQQSYSMWDTVLYESVMESDITLLLNCSCMDAQMDGDHIQSVTGWQTTTQQYHRITAKIVADCSGDGVLAPITGAEYRVGREARSEFNESIAPAVADKKTMGMTILFQAKEHDTPQPFIAPTWANVYESCDDLPYGAQGHKWFQMGYWWLELGGEHDSIHDTEKLRHELLKVVYGVWDHLKNHCENKSSTRNWALDWVQFLPGKRESRRYVGQHILNQNEIASGGHFDDIIGYGGWTMDDHHPAGFESRHLEKEESTIFHDAPSPYGIPYGVIVSKNIDNLMFAGRDASCTHAAMSSTRVMGTCFTMGQALGTAAAIAVKKGISPWAVSEDMDELQQTLIQDDCYLPWIQEVLPELTMQAKLTASVGHPEPVRDGWNRTIDEDDHAWIGTANEWIAYEFEQPTMVHEVRLALDSALDMEVAMSHLRNEKQMTTPPPTLPEEFLIVGKIGDDWVDLIEVTDNHHRVFKAELNRELSGITFVLKKTWGDVPSRVFHFSVR